jgi:hypothetical protein
MHDGPSLSALLLPFSVHDAAAWLRDALAADGFRPATKPVPKSERRFPDESISLDLVAGPDSGPPSARTPTTIAVSVDVARIFFLAQILSTRSRETVFSALRCFAGFEPVLKVFFSGGPQWKDGEDPDHEVFHAVPRTQPAELRVPGAIAIPTEADAALRECGPAITAVLGGGATSALSLHWLHRRSTRTT